MSYLLAVASVALLVLAVSIFKMGRAFLLMIDRQVPLADSVVPYDELKWIHEGVAKNALEIKNLTLAVSDGIARVDRAEKRVQKTVTSARRLVREAGIEHAGIEAEYEELQPVDGEPLEEQPVLPLFEDVEDARPSGIPGLSNAALAALQRR